MLSHFRDVIQRSAFLRVGKFFLPDCVRIAWNAWLSLSGEMSKNAGVADFIGLIASLPLMRSFGAAVAVA